MPINTTLWRAGLFFALAFPCSFSFPQGFTPDIGAYGAVPAEWLVRFVAEQLLGWQAGSYKSLLMSDTSGFYLNFANLLLLSLLASALWQRFNPASDAAAWRERFRTVARFYLAWQMLHYGWAKVFKTQFYLPEPNTLYTPLGELHQDIVFWSLIGSNNAYSLLGGALEVAAALLLFSRRLSRTGALLAAIVMAQIFLFNLAFNISVKVLSAYLLALSLALLACDARALGHFLLPQYIAYAPPAPVPQKSYTFRILALKISLPLLLIASSLYPFYRASHWHDDQRPRPPLHGAYAVETHILHADTLPPLPTQPQRIQRLAIHRQGYFILQNMHDQWRSFPLLDVDTLQKTISIALPDSSTHTYQYEKISDNTLILSDLSQRLHLRRLPYRELPFLQQEFDWTTDDY